MSVQYKKKTSTTGMHKFSNQPRIDVNIFTHIGTNCLKTSKDLDYPTIVSWKESLCKPSDTANTEIQLRRVHTQHEDVVAYFEKRPNKKR